jgi:hypothetical protein
MGTLLFGLLLAVAVGVAGAVFVNRRQFHRRNMTGQGYGSIPARQPRPDEVPTEIPGTLG